MDQAVGAVAEAADMDCVVIVQPLDSAVVAPSLDWELVVVASAHFVVTMATPWPCHV